MRGVSLTLRRSRGASALAAAALLLAGCLSAPEGARTVALPVDGAAALASVNAFREENGLPALAIDRRLAAAAEAQAAAMAAGDRLDHAVAGRLPARVERAGYDWAVTAENIGRGYASFDAAMAGWIASRDHRRNLLNPAVRDIGFAGARPAGGGRPYWAQVFGSERRRLPGAPPPAGLALSAGEHRRAVPQEAFDRPVVEAAAVAEAVAPTVEGRERHEKHGGAQHRRTGARRVGAEALRLQRGAAQKLPEFQVVAEDGRNCEARPAVGQHRHQRPGIDLGADRKVAGDDRSRSGRNEVGRAVRDGERGFDAPVGRDRVAPPQRLAPQGGLRGGSGVAHGRRSSSAGGAETAKTEGGKEEWRATSADEEVEPGNLRCRWAPCALAQGPRQGQLPRV